MNPAGLALFDTAIGPCGVAWRPNGIVAVQLPESSAEATLARLRRRAPGAVESTPPAAVTQAIAAIGALLAGQASDLAGIVLDFGGLPDFDCRVYEAARSIPAGRTLTYGEIAARLGEPGGAQAVGRALGRNPFPIVVPCHRVTAAGGRLGGFSAHGGTATKRRLLTIEGTLTAEPSLPGLG
jgi:methylated-DNA-[protein]-cysteine S-methyltransferase